MLVSTVESCFVLGTLRGVSTHWAFPARLPRGRDSPNRLDLTQWTHHYPIHCALRVRIQSHSLSSCSTTTKLRQTTGCVSPDRLASRVDCLSLSLLHYSVVLSLGHFRPDEHTRLLRHRAYQSRVCKKNAQPLVLLHSSSHLR